MKKASTIFMLVLFAWILQACGDTKKDDTTADDSGITATVNDDDKAFAVYAFESGVDVLEISFATQSKLVNNKVKDLAGLILKERDKINADLLTITKSKNIMTPASLSVDAQTAADELNQKTGADLDKAYTGTMLTEYKKSIELFENAAGDVDDKQLKAFAEKNLPVLKKHLATITTLYDGLK